MKFFIESAYFLASILFILGLKKLGSPDSAKRGNLLSACGMLLAVVATLAHEEIVSIPSICIAMFVGSLIGIYMAQKVAMTAMPEMVALLNGLGGLSSLCVGTAFVWSRSIVTPLDSLTLALSIFIGGITFTGSVVAWGKLKGVLPTKSIVFFAQKTLTSLLLFASAFVMTFLAIDPAAGSYFYACLIGFCLVLGLLFVFPIGGADMPVVISLLNSYSGLAASASGFVIQNSLLIISGALVGTSGIILTSIMCKAMNRSLSHVLFSGFSLKSASKKAGEKGSYKSMQPDDAYYLLESAKTILVVPGYGLAVAQAQHSLKELSALFEENGSDVRYAIHPVAGRMPGHMNVLLAEAGISYDALVEMDEINPTMEQVDVCIVIGANDVVNPSAKEDTSSPIYGMPVIETHRAKNVLILKRSMGSGFSGIENPLFFKSNAAMLFGDAKKTLQSLVTSMKNG